MFADTVTWLLNQGYTFSHGHSPSERLVLTDKALVAMNVVPPSLNQSRGSELVNATTQGEPESKWDKLVDLAGVLIGSAIKTVIS